MKKGMLSHEEITKESIYEDWVVNRLSQKQIAEKYNVGLWLIESRIKTFKLTRIRSKIKYVLNKKHVDINSPVFWYLVGLVISDGFIDEANKRIMITLVGDNEILETISYYYSTEIKIPVYNYLCKNGKIKYSLTLSDEDLINLFHSIGINGVRKTYTTSMPDPKSLYLFNFLLRGFIDGDGNIRYIKNTKRISFRFYSQSPKLTEDVISLFSKYYESKLNCFSVKGKDGYNIEASVLPINTLINIYSDIPQLSIRRKRNIVKEEVDDIVHRYEMINRSNW